MEDEVQFQQQGSRIRMWISGERKDPVLPHPSVKAKVGYFGAVRMKDGKFVYSREGVSFNARTFFAFLKFLKSQSAKKGKKVVVVLDNARYHHAKYFKKWVKKHEEKFGFLFLPPYSPQLNTSERIWKLTKRLKIHNQYFPNLKTLIMTVEEQFEKWFRPNPTLRKLCVKI